MLKFTTGNMFDVDADIRVNTVNCVGVMGAGVALAFKQRYPEMYRAYKRECELGNIRPGKMHIWRNLSGDWIVNFPTKRHWREKSKYEDIESGLLALREYLEQQGEVRVTLPALGSGHGGLDWSRVSTMIQQHLQGLPSEIIVFDPADSRNFETLSQFYANSEIRRLKETAPAFASSLSRVNPDEIYYEGDLNILKNTDLTLILSSKPDSKEEVAALESVRELPRNNLNVCMVLGSGVSTRLAEILLDRGNQIAAWIPQGLVRYHAPKALRIAPREKNLLLLSLAKPQQPWNPRLADRTLLAALLTTKAALISDPQPVWLSQFNDLIINERKGSVFQIRYKDSNVKNTFLEKATTAIGRRTSDGKPNLSPILDALALGAAKDSALEKVGCVSDTEMIGCGRTGEVACRLKPEQAIAAHTLDRHLSVTAGPGSGKTTVLVERYLEILRTQNVSVDNIVAITFTNRAANEMRERVRTRIDELLRDAEGDERRRWLRHKRSLEGAVVTTIHGFCSRLLHEFPVEANIDPQFVLLDEHQAAMMLEAVVDEALSDAIHHGNEKIVQLTQAVGGRGSLARVLADFYLDFRGEGLSLPEIKDRTAPNHAGQRDYAAAVAELDARMSALFAVPVRTPSARQKREMLAAAWPSLRAIVAEPPTDRTIAKYTQAIEDFHEVRPSRRGNDADAVRLVDEMLWGENSKSDDRLAGKLPCLGFDLLARNYASAVLNLMHEIERRLDDEKQRLSVVDFDDLQLRTLKLVNEHPEVLNSLTGRYKFFLVDEFQDTNGLQRDLMKKLALRSGANLFIVGDRKQSIYGFRGADVDVFREMTEAIEANGGVQQPLHLNFRSQPPLIECLNFLFAKVFHARAEVPADQLDQLGFVEHEPSIAARGTDDNPPLVEMLVSILPDGRRFGGDSEDEDEGPRDKYDSRDARERDAAQLVERITELTAGGYAHGSSANSDSAQNARAFNYGDIAILFRALTVVGTYEGAFRRAGIPYLTVQGKGFYQREEITDLIQLLRFLDNTTDEIALAAVLRSPLCGISDNALLALRSAPLTGEPVEERKLPRRNLWRAIRRHHEIQFIDEQDHAQLDRAAEFLDVMIRRRGRYAIAELLRVAVSETDFMAVIAANFDGAQRITNIEKLFRLAETFEKSGQLIRDFVHYVKEFEEEGGRESEGQMDKTANVVRLMTIHQAKGLEFPVVIIPDLHRSQSQREGGPYVLDRHRGFTVNVPDGRGLAVRGALFKELRQRAGWREEFESMRLLYVAATRAKDRLIFSAAVAGKELKNLKETTREQWLAWLWQAFDWTSTKRVEW
jgi:ATP-dependent helicase/nuclease subunit A